MRSESETCRVGDRLPIDGVAMKSSIRGLLAHHLTPVRFEWLESAVEIGSSIDRNRLLSAYSGMTRRLGKNPLGLTADESKQWLATGPLLPLDHWGADEVGRALLLLSVAQSAPGEFSELALDCYWNGDSREQQSWLRSLVLLPEPEQFLDTAMDACRTNIIPLFEAIACENPYPARYFPELNFNQMVLKALFNVIALERIAGLADRMNPELSRMADDYVSERVAADRYFPEDIWMAVVPFAPDASMERVYRYLDHEDGNQRRWVSHALGFRSDDVSRKALEARREKEDEIELVEVIDRSLARMKEDPKGVRS